MSLRHLRQVAQLGRQLPAQLRRPIRLESALPHLRERLEFREKLYLAAARRMIFDHPESPHGRLLRRAGCDFDDFRRGVETDGLETTLAKLRDAGVYITLEEFKRQTPIERPGLTLHPAEADFDNPLLTSGGITGTTSGSRAQAMRVMYNWEFIAEEAEHELLLYTHHGVIDAPLALWYPAPPGVAGIHNVMMTLKTGRAPTRWFSQTDPAGANVPGWHRLTVHGIRLGARLSGLSVPPLEFADVARVDVVLEWMLTAKLKSGTCVLRTFASSAVRLAELAQQRGADLSGATIFTGGEPLTDLRRQFIEATGARVYARYIATEPGLLAASCRYRSTTDDMHVYSDRVAMIEHPTGLLVTTLSPAAGKVLFNTALGDTGELSRRSCDCEFGQLGFDQRVVNVRSQQRLTAEGMTVQLADLDAAVAEAIVGAGGSPDAYQLRQAPDTVGHSRIEILVSPTLGPLDEPVLLHAIHASMTRQGGAIAMAAEVWAKAGTMQLVRAAPALGAKRTSARVTS